MDKNICNKAKSFVISKDTGNPYHNFEHILSVLNRVQRNPLYNTLTDDERMLLDLAAIFHDAGYSMFNSEEKNLAIAVSLLDEFRISSGDLKKTESDVISELIYSTDNRNLNFIKDDSLYLMRAILKDADVTQTVIDDGDLWRDRLAKEFGLSFDKDSVLDFVNSIDIFTPYGKKLVNDWKERNFSEVSDGSK